MDIMQRTSLKSYFCYGYALYRSNRRPDAETLLLSPYNTVSVRLSLISLLFCKDYSWASNASDAGSETAHWVHSATLKSVKVWPVFLN